MRRRSATGRRDFNPHREFSIGALAVQENGYFFAECVQHARIILPDNRS